MIGVDPAAVFRRGVGASGGSIFGQKKPGKKNVGCKEKGREKTPPFEVWIWRRSGVFAFDRGPDFLVCQIKQYSKETEQQD